MNINKPPNLLSIPKCLILSVNDFSDWNMKMYENNQTHWGRTATCTKRIYDAVPSDRQ